MSKADTTPSPPDVLALTFDDVARQLHITRRTLEKLRASGNFPQPDAKIGRRLLWRPETIKEWIARGGGS